MQASILKLASSALVISQLALRGKQMEACAAAGKACVSLLQGAGVDDVMTLDIMQMLQVWGLSRGRLHYALDQGGASTINQPAIFDHDRHMNHNINIT